MCVTAPVSIASLASFTRLLSASRLRVRVGCLTSDLVRSTSLSIELAGAKLDAIVDPTRR